MHFNSRPSPTFGALKHNRKKKTITVMRRASTQIAEKFGIASVPKSKRPVSLPKMKFMEERNE